MYGGRVVERGSAQDIFYRPCHEYTKRLLMSIPNIENDEKERLTPILGTPIDLLNMPAGCAFSPRCERAMQVCLQQSPKELLVGDNHRSACWRNVQVGLEQNLLQLDEEGELIGIEMSKAVERTVDAQ